MIDLKQVNAEASGRAAVWGLLARLFNEELDGQGLALLASGAGGVLDALIALGTDSEAIARIRKVGEDTTEGAVTDLAAEYAGLFETHKKVYPFASCWVPGERPRLLGPRAAAAQKAYAEVGLGLAEGDVFRADHVGVELNFLAVLAGRVASATTEDEAAIEQDRYDRFMVDSVLPWMPAFFEAVSADSRASFYADAARVAGAFVKLDAEMLAPLGDR